MIPTLNSGNGIFTKASFPGKLFNNYSTPNFTIMTIPFQVLHCFIRKKQSSFSKSFKKLIFKPSNTIKSRFKVVYSLFNE